VWWTVTLQELLCGRTLHCTRHVWGNQAYRQLRDGTLFWGIACNMQARYLFLPWYYQSLPTMCIWNTTNKQNVFNVKTRG